MGNDLNGNGDLGHDEAMAAVHHQAGDMARAMRSAGATLLDEDTLLGQRCATCDGFMCLDCAEGVPHSKCTRTCLDCALEHVDWDEELEMTRIITELTGLVAVDEAIATLDDALCDGERGLDEPGEHTRHEN